MVRARIKGDGRVLGFYTKALQNTEAPTFLLVPPIPSMSSVCFLLKGAWGSGAWHSVKPGSAARNRWILIPVSLNGHLTLDKFVRPEVLSSIKGVTCTVCRPVSVSVWEETAHSSWVV